MIPTSPLALRAEDIVRLDPAAFVDFLNHLINAEAHRHGLPGSSIEITDKIYAKDSGVDARVNDIVGGSRWFFPGRQVLQFRSASITPAALEKEFVKSGIQEAIRRGDGYLILLGRDYSDPERQLRENKVDSLFRDAGIPRKCILLTATQLTVWANEHPALLVLPYFGRPIGDLMRHETWSSLSQHKIPYKADSHRRVTSREIQGIVANTSQPVHIRLEGLPGVGKTRLALEALRVLGLQERVLYARERNDVPGGFIGWVRQSPSASLILVVDECDRRLARGLAEQAETVSGRLQLVTIGPAEEGEPLYPAYLYSVQTLADDELARVVTAVAPGLHREAVQFIVSTSEGYVRVAVTVAEAIGQDPSLTTAQAIAASARVQHLLRLLIPKGNARRAMQGFALLDRVGMEGEVALEGQALADFLEISWADLNDIDAEMREHGFLARRGRYRYVTPHLMAIWLAAEAWSERRENVVKLLDKFPTGRGRRGLLIRLGDLGGHDYAQSVAVDLLGPNGICPTIQELNDESRSEIFRTLSGVDPDAAIASLERLVGSLDVDELRKFTRGRRQVVWALVHLAWSPATFGPASRILLNLAEAETEAYANNATGSWISLFQTTLGGTAVPALERHKLLKDILMSDSPSRRVLAVKAVGTALKASEMRFGGSETQGGRILPPEWHPSSPEENLAVRKSALSLLGVALRDDEESVRKTAHSVLLEVKRNLVAFGLGDDLIRLLDGLRPDEERERVRLRQAIEELLRYDESRLSAQQQAMLQEIHRRFEGSTYHERIRRWVGPWSLEDHKSTAEGLPFAAQKARALADEGFARPSDLRAELLWLGSPSAENVLWFAERLGELDTTREWLDPFIELVRKGEAWGLLAGYLRGQRKQHAAWVEAYLDELAAADAAYSRAILESTWRGPSTAQAAQRLAKLVEEGRLRASDLELLIWGAWVRPLPSDAFQALLKPLVESNEVKSTEVALTFLDTWLEDHHGEEARFEHEAWDLIGRPAGMLAPSIIQHYWEEVARKYFQQDPVRMAMSILEAYRASDKLLHEWDPSVQLLTEATRLRQKEVWEATGKALLEGGDFGLKLRLGLEGWYGEVIGSEILVEWAKQHGGEAAVVIAHLARARGNPLPELARQILVTFGDKEAIANALYMNVVSGGWSGPGSAHYSRIRDEARLWLEDPEARVRDWATEVIQGLQAHIEMHRRWEEESESRIG